MTTDSTTKSQPTRLETLQRLIARAAALKTTDPASAVVKLRVLVEGVLDALLGQARGAGVPQRIQLAQKTYGISNRATQTLNDLQVRGNGGAHFGYEVRHEQVKVEQAQQMLDELASQFPAQFGQPEPEPKMKPEWMELAGRVSDPDGFYLIRNEGDTYVVEVRAGIPALRWTALGRLLLGHEDQLWEWTSVSELRPTMAMTSLPDFDEPSNPMYPVTWQPGSVARLLNLRRGEYWPPVEAQAGYDECEFFEMWGQTIREIWGAVGPFVLVYTTDRGYFGGAHDHWGCDFVVFDLRSGAPYAGWLPEVSTYFDRRGGMPTAATLWEGDEVEPLFDPMCVPTALKFDLGPRKLKVEVQLTQTDWNFAGSDGAWSDYTRSVSLEIKKMLPFLEDVTETPEVVRHVFKFFSVSGWSRLNLDLETHLVTQLDEPWLR